MNPWIRRTLSGVVLLAGAALAAGLPARGAPDGAALSVDIDGAIGPATVKLFDDALDAAKAQGVRLVILRMDTPGGLSDSMRQIIRGILASPIPVATYVAPSGARAASAGTYILYASHIAAMAPGTNLGAATPIQIGGLPLPGGGGNGNNEKQNKETSGQGAVLEHPEAHKMVNDAVAYIRALAELRGRNVDWAEQAVREAASLPASEALKRGVIDVIATSTNDLLRQVDGRTVLVGDTEKTLDTAGLKVEHFEPSWQVELLAVITNPNVAFILMMVGVYGLILEFAHPGAIGPGVIGAISLLFGLYALNLLPLDYTAFALVLLGIGLMTAEAVTPTFGVLGVGGLAAFLLGAVFLFQSDSPEFRLSWWTIGTTTAASGGLLILLLGYVWRVHRRPAVTGASEMVGHPAVVVTWNGSEGEIRVRGEVWRARCTDSLKPGETVVVDAIEGLTLSVSRPGRPKKGGH